MGLDYHYPNLWVRLLGRANESEIEIDGIISKALIDSGAMISMMSKEYCDKHRYKIQHLDQLEGSEGAEVPYLGYVEVKMQILGINSFEQDVLMIVSHTTTHYHKRVPFQVCSRIIDQVVKNIIDEELKIIVTFLETGLFLFFRIIQGESKRVQCYVGTVLSKSSQVRDKEFDLDQVKENVVITKKVTIPTFQTIIV